MRDRECRYLKVARHRFSSSSYIPIYSSVIQIYAYYLYLPICVLFSEKIKCASVSAYNRPVLYSEEENTRDCDNASARRLTGASFKSVEVMP